MGDEFWDGAGGTIFKEPGGGGNIPDEVPIFGFDFNVLSVPSFF